MLSYFKNMIVRLETFDLDIENVIIDNKFHVIPVSRFDIRYTPGITYSPYTVTHGSGRNMYAVSYDRPILTTKHRAEYVRSSEIKLPYRLCKITGTGPNGSTDVCIDGSVFPLNEQWMDVLGKLTGKKVRFYGWNDSVYAYEVLDGSGEKIYIKSNIVWEGAMLGCICFFGGTVCLAGLMHCIRSFWRK